MKMGDPLIKKRIFELPFERGSVPASEFSDWECLKSCPLVSVVMLAYNHEAYISQSIEGIVAQETSFSVELIIGEDCSPDGTLSVVRSYQRKYPGLIRIITSDTNVGARKNSYRLEKSARGKYIAYCEGDDYWHDSKKLQKQVDFLEENESYGMVYTNADSFNVTTQVRVPFAVPVRSQQTHGGDPYLQQLTGAMHIWPLTVCVRKELSLQILDKCPEVTDQSYAMGDTQRFLELARLTKIQYMPISTATRNLLPESATNSKSIEKKAEFVRSSQQLILHYLKKYPLPIRQDKEIRIWVAKRALYYAYRCQDMASAEAELTNLKNLGCDLHWKYVLFAFGSQSYFRHSVVILLFKILKKISQIKKRY